MAIKLNGVTINNNRLNRAQILQEKLNGTLVYSAYIFEWFFIGRSSSEPTDNDLLFIIDIGGDEIDGKFWLDTNYPATNYNLGTIAVIGDQTTHEYFSYVAGD